MNRVMKKTGMMMAMATIISLGASCSDDNNENQSGDNALSVNEQKMEAIANQYVTNTIYQTYGAIADATNQLYENLAVSVRVISTKYVLSFWRLERNGRRVRRSFMVQLPTSVSTHTSTLGLLMPTDLPLP